MSESLDKMPPHVREQVLKQMAKEDKAKVSRGAAPYIPPKPKRPVGKGKYRNERTHCDILDRAFDSKFEMSIARRLYARQQAGEISELNFQVRVCLLGCVYMKPDFQYIEDGELITHEAKGMETPKYVLQRKLWAVAGPTRYRISYQSKTDVDMTPEPTPEMIELVKKHMKRTKT